MLWRRHAIFSTVTGISKESQSMAFVIVDIRGWCCWNWIPFYENIFAGMLYNHAPLVLYTNALVKSARAYNIINEKTGKWIAIISFKLSEGNVGNVIQDSQS